MINLEQKLNPKLFDASIEQEPIRKGFGEGLLVAAEKDSRIVGLCADLTESTQMHFFKNKFPERFVEIGVAEQNLAAVASGMASMGKIPFITSYAMFSPGRNWEQIRTTIAYNNTNVKIIGSHAGVSVGPDGGTHQAIEDIALMRVIPRMTVIAPCDSIEAKKATIAAANIEGPVYIRLAREKTPVITTELSPFDVGRAQVVWRAKKDARYTIGIIASGALLYKALVVALDLEGEGVGVSVLNLATIKPIDEHAIIELVKSTGRILTIEEHQIAGGMGSAVAEVLARNHPVPMEFVGVDDKFGQSGLPDELLEHYGMGVVNIKRKAKKLLGRT
ncbi:MAG: transketolase C-terminal domain-containing protein, partial [Patescibacteria group bacterium]